jgi:hypothetical protein
VNVQDRAHRNPKIVTLEPAFMFAAVALTTASLLIAAVLCHEPT